MNYYVTSSITNEVGLVLKGRVLNGTPQLLVQWGSGIREWVDMDELTQID